jgi:hypothetical protein
MEKLNIRNKNEIANKLSLEMLKLIQEQEAKINFLTKNVKDINSYLLKAELESYILATCLNIIGDKYNLSRQEKRKIILQAIEKIFPDILS